MAAPDLTTEEGISTYLHNSDLSFCPKVTRVERLAEAFAGFVFRVCVEGAVQKSVIVKHVEGYAARAQSWKLDQSRMMYEAKAMDYLSQPEMQSEKSIRVPNLLHYDNEKHIIIMEDAGDLPSLKGWLQPGGDPNTTAAIGEVLGRYLAKVHNSTAGQRDLLENFNGNATAKHLSGTLYFGTLPSTAEKLGYTGDYFSEVASVGQREVEESNEVLTLGDFWTGNILVDSKAPQDFRLYVLDLELSKPGTAAFDIGQMAAEMYCLAAFRDHDLGLALLKGFLKAYKNSREGAVGVAKVAIRVGVHLLVTMPVAWSNEASHDQINEITDIGADLIRIGWHGDEKGLRDSIIGTLV